MKLHLLTLCILLGSMCSISLVYGDNIPTYAEWDDEYYRSITTIPPTLSIENNVLSVEFMDALDDLTIRIINETGTIMYENILSGDTGEITHIQLDGIGSGIFKVILTHEHKWLVGEFENQ